MHGWDCSFQNLGTTTDSEKLLTPQLGELYCSLFLFLRLYSYHTKIVYSGHSQYKQLTKRFVDDQWRTHLPKFKSYCTFHNLIQSVLFKKFQHLVYCICCSGVENKIIK